MDLRFAPIWSEIAFLYEFVGAVKRYLENERAANRHKGISIDRNGQTVTRNFAVL